MQFNPRAVADALVFDHCCVVKGVDEISKLTNGSSLFGRCPVDCLWSSQAIICFSCFSPPPEVRRWGNLKETLLRFQRTHDFSATFEALTEGELAGDYFNALGNHRQELLRQHVGSRLHPHVDRGRRRSTCAGLTLLVCCS